MDFSNLSNEEQELALDTLQRMICNKQREESEIYTIAENLEWEICDWTGFPIPRI